MVRSSDEATPVISVAELARRLRFAAERTTGQEWIEGEVTSLRRAASGHVYFVAKDEREDAAIDCVMYRSSALRARSTLEEGARVQLRGKATVWVPRGRLQVIVDSARPAGRGALLEALERRKQQLAAEGLFDAARKRPLPEQPRIVGVVTSSAGAAFADIRTVALRRGNVKIVLSAARVQGEGAAASIIAAIDKIERYPGLDVLIVGRGGGSSEDLMAFNEERVVRRVAAARVPVISAVGHEIDTTLTDLVADVRAATPSQAAELAVPDARAREAELAVARRRLANAMLARIEEDRSTARLLRSRLGDPRFLLAHRQQSLDAQRVRLERRVEQKLAAARLGLVPLERRLAEHHPRLVLARGHARLDPLVTGLGVAMRARLARRRSQLGEHAGKLQALSPLTVLTRGYAIVTNDGGRAVRDASAVQVGDVVDVRLHRGRLVANVTQALPLEDTDD